MIMMLMLSFQDPVGTNAFEGASTAMLEEVIRLSLLPAWAEWLTPRLWSKMFDAVGQFHSKLTSIRATHENETDQRKTMVSELLRVERDGLFSKKEVDSELLGMIVAGHETTATTGNRSNFQI